MKLERSSGILLHPTSLPGKYGIGDLGPQAHRWVDFLAGSGCKLWQVLPLGPTGYADSPYQCFSAFAGNPYLVSPEALLEEGLLAENDLSGMPEFPAGKVDYGALIPWKLNLLDRAYEHFEASGSEDLKSAYHSFRAAQACWLDDFSLFMALKDAHDARPWPTWEEGLRDCQPAAILAARKKYAVAVQRQAFRQFLFFRQWGSLREHAHRLGVHIIGDAPIFVAHDSADVWSNPYLFYLDPKGRPKMVAGVPPDYFSPTGQLWGNPIYRWREHRRDGYRWWISRLRAALEMVDLLRLDHFRGFAGYWEVPGRAKTAEKGRWVRAPGMDFFTVLRQELGELPIIAEDLGVITPDVVALRQRFGLPGMKIVQFGFGGNPRDSFLPHNYPVQCVVYTGTHDNDTARGWYEQSGEAERSFYRRYLDRTGEHVAWDMIRAAWASVGVLALAPMQDFLELGNEARMNYPGRVGGYWTWRMADAALTDDLQGRIRELNFLYAR